MFIYVYTNIHTQSQCSTVRLISMRIRNVSSFEKLIFAHVQFSIMEGINLISFLCSKVNFCQERRNGWKYIVFDFVCSCSTNKVPLDLALFFPVV